MELPPLKVKVRPDEPGSYSVGAQEFCVAGDGLWNLSETQAAEVKRRCETQPDLQGALQKLRDAVYNDECQQRGSIALRMARLGAESALAKATNAGGNGDEKGTHLSISPYTSRTNAFGALPQRTVSGWVLL